jgi:predicted metalloendopeptidase
MYNSPRIPRIAFVLGVLGMCFFKEASADDHAHPTGLALHFRDTDVRPQDDLYRYVSGKWLKEAELPPDQARYGSFDELREKSEKDVRAILDDLSMREDLNPGDERAKVRDLYRSFMATDQIQAQGLTPLRQAFVRIDAIQSTDDLIRVMGQFQLEGITSPLNIAIEQDGKNSTRYLVHLIQSGLGLPDRDYYLKEEDTRLRTLRERYEAHIARVFEALGEPDSGARAASIVALEREIARVQWSKTDLRDPVKSYNMMSLKDLDAIAPHFKFQALLTESGIPESQLQEMIVTTPSYFRDSDGLLASTPLETWKTYFKWHMTRFMMPYLPEPWIDLDFDFYGKTLRGIPQLKPRWKRGVAVVEAALGDAVGKEYVTQHFPAESKARMESLVSHLMQAYKESIESLPWMSEPTRKAAQQKLAKMNVKVGYSKKWRDYSALEIQSDDLVGNILRFHVFESRRQIARLGHPVDRDEWLMTPQTVNAYYNPAMNEIVFPAAILQPPFFNASADDAVNYGGIGAVIGHEISHGFDDMGSQYDGDGNLVDWFTPQDHQKFKEKTERLVEQYERYEPVPGYHVNGHLTLGENIADNSGLAIAYKAYLLSLRGESAPEMEGLTGLQRLYMGWAQVWRGKVRESEAVRLIKVDPHSPAAVRGNAPLVNQPGFYEAFGVKPGDQLYLPESDRVTIW